MTQQVVVSTSIFVLDGTGPYLLSVEADLDLVVLSVSS
jgi:hypothetical protein